MTLEEERLYKIRKDRYQHLLKVAETFKDIGDRYEEAKETDTRMSPAQQRKATPQHGTRVDKDMGQEREPNTFPGPSTAPPVAPQPGPAPDIVTEFRKDIDFLKLKLMRVKLQLATLLHMVKTLQDSVDASSKNV